MPFGWEGDKVRLVPLDKERHFENTVRWVNDPEITWRTLVGDFPLTRLAEHEYFDRAGRGDSDISFAVETLTEDEEHIGLVGLHDINYRHGSASLGLIIGRRQLWGRGFGTDIAAVATRYAFEVAGLRLVLAEVMADNVASYKAILKAGFTEVGRIPHRYWKRGAYRDNILLAAYRDDRAG